MEIFTPGWNFNSVYRVEKNCRYIKNFNPGWNITVWVNRKFNESKKAKPEVPKTNQNKDGCSQQKVEICNSL